MSDTEKIKDNDTKEAKEVKGETKNVSPLSSNKTAEIVKVEKPKVPSLTQDELSTLDYNDFSTPARMLQLGKVLAKSKLVPLKSPEDVVVALMTGKELGLPFVTSVSQIYPINGRPTLGVHIQKAILLKNGVIFEKIEDAEDIYQYAKKEGDKTIPLNIGTINEQPKDSLKKKVDVRTTYLFTRQIKMANGSYKEMTAKGSFSLSEAREAELTDKDVWVKYWRRMLDARAFTNGAREIADDLLLGIMTPNELNNDFYVNQQGEEVHNATIIDSNTN